MITQNMRLSPTGKYGDEESSCAINCPSAGCNARGGKGTWEASNGSISFLALPQHVDDSQRDNSKWTPSRP